jgi:hypothetical protein
MKPRALLATCALLLAWASAANAQDAAAASTRRWTGQLALGAEAATLYGLTSYGPRGVLSIGREIARTFTAGELAYGYGRSSEGLAFHDVRLGFTVGQIFGPVRLGGGITSAWLGIPRASAEGGVLGHFGAGASALIGVDVVRSESATFGLEARGDAVWLFPGLRPTGSLLASVRF